MTPPALRSAGNREWVSAKGATGMVEEVVYSCNRAAGFLRGSYCPRAEQATGELQFLAANLRRPMHQ